MLRSALQIRRESNEWHARGATSRRLGYRLGAADGIFCEWNWDGRELVVRNDRFGCQPVYYSAGTDRFLISPSILDLLKAGAPRDLDPAGLAVFLRLGYYIGTRTPFASIKALPPNAVLRWNGGDPEVCATPENHKPLAIGRDEAIRVFADLFRAAIRKRLPPAGARTALALSGGRDSRHILLELCRAGCPPQLCGTIDSNVKNEAAIAALLASRLGVRHRVFPQAMESVRNEARRNLATGFCSDEHQWMLHLADWWRANVDVGYDGLAGDVLSAGLFLSDENLRWCRLGREDSWAEELLRERSRACGLLLNPEARVRLSDELALGEVVAEMRRHRGQPNPVGAFYLANRTRREVALAPFALFRAGLTHVPYLDHELYDFLASLPAELLVDHRFHTDTILREFPEAADVPFSQSQPRVPYRHLWKWAAETLVSVREPELLDMRRIRLRLLRALAHPGRLSEVAWLATPAIYLAQIEAARAGDWENALLREDEETRLQGATAP